MDKLWIIKKEKRKETKEKIKKYIYNIYIIYWRKFKQ